MNIADKNAFLEHKKVIKIDLLNGSDSSFVIALNMPVGTYYKIICLVDLFECSNNVNEQYLTAAEICENILNLDNRRRITTQWIIENIALENQIDLITMVMDEVNKLIEDDVYKLPDIKVIQEAPKDKAGKDRQKTKDEINKLSALLADKKDIVLIEDITILMTKTKNSYFDILEMPILIFKDAIKTILLNEFRTDDNYNLAYLQYETKRIKADLRKNLKAVNKTPAQVKGADLKKLKAILN